RYIARSAASTRASTVIGRSDASATPQAMVGRRLPSVSVPSAMLFATRRITRSAASSGAPGNRIANSSPPMRATVSRSRTPAERLAARALDAEHADALLAELQRHAEDGLDVRRTVEARIGLRSGDVLQLAVLDHPPADADAACEQLPDVGLRRADRGAHDERLVLVVERQQEAVLVAHRLADDPQQAARELVDVEHRADLRSQPLEDGELSSMRVRGRCELLEQAARTGNIRHVLLFDRADAAEIGGAVLTVAVDDAAERVGDSGTQL